MKMFTTKRGFSLILAMVFVFGMIPATAVAEDAAAAPFEFDLTDTNWKHENGIWAGWATDGAEPTQRLEDVESIGLTMERLLSAEFLVIEMNSPIENDDSQLLLSSPKNVWVSTDAFPYLSADNKTYVIDLCADQRWMGDIHGTDIVIDWAAFMIAGNGQPLDIKRAYLTDTDPGIDLGFSDGIFIANRDDHGWAGANIILGSNPGVWPYSKSDRPAAFIPEPGEEYTLMFSVLSEGATGFSARWMKDDSGGSDVTYTTADTAAFAELTPPVTQWWSDSTPAFFPDSIAKKEDKIYTVHFRMDGDAPPDGLLGSIAIRGLDGSSDFQIKWVKIVGDSGKGETVAVNRAVLHEIDWSYNPVLPTVIEFQDWDGSVLKTSEFTDQTARAAPPAPARPGWTFTGWDMGVQFVPEGGDAGFNVYPDPLIVTALYTQDADYAVKDAVMLSSSPTWVNRLQQQGWATTGAQPSGFSIDSGLTLEALRSKNYLVVELNSPTDDAEGLQFGVVTNKVGWANWKVNSHLSPYSYLSPDHKLIAVDLNNSVPWSDFIRTADITWAAFHIQDWGPDGVWLDIKRAYLTNAVEIDDGGYKADVTVDSNTHGDFKNNADKISIQGAGFNADEETTVALHFSKPVSEKTLPMQELAEQIGVAKLNTNTAVQVQIGLRSGAKELEELLFPVTITVPVPTGLGGDPEKFWILHERKDGSFFAIKPVVNTGSNPLTCSFTVSDFSLFAFVAESMSTYTVEYYADSFTNMIGAPVPVPVQRSVGARLTPGDVAADLEDAKWLNAKKDAAQTNSGKKYGVALVSYPALSDEPGKNVVKVLYMPIP